MSDIKKKFLDILFEPETEEVEADAPLVDVKEKTIEEVKYNEVKEQVKSPNVKDVLYGRQDKPSSFIDYFEVPKKEKPVFTVNEEAYEMRDNVSPIFGPIVLKEKKRKTATEKEVQKAVNNNNQEYTGIVISPIYGYDVSKANDARKKLLDKPQKIEESDDYLYGYDDEPAFDIPEDMNETIKEAIQEAVVELNPSRTNIIEQNAINQIQEEKEEVPQTDEDVYEDPIEEFTFIEPTNNKYKQPEIQIEETPQENEGYEEVGELNDVIEEYEEPVTEYEEEPEIEEIEELAEETFKKVDDFSDTQEIKIEETKESVPKATRSIYDTTPIQLFDFDELVEKGESDKDLFDELVGDDD